MLSASATNTESEGYSGMSLMGEREHKQKGDGEIESKLQYGWVHLYLCA